MAIKRKILKEYISQIVEDTPGTCTHVDKKDEEIIRGYDCVYISVPRLETEPIYCLYHKREVTPNCFCCWAKRKPVLKEFRRGNKIIPEQR